MNNPSLMFEPEIFDENSNKDIEKIFKAIGIQKMLLT